MKSRLALIVFLFIACNSAKKQEITYVGSALSNKYHYISCEWAQRISKHNLVTFRSVSDARAAGYVACRVCRPPGEDIQ